MSGTLKQTAGVVDAASLPLSIFFGGGGFWWWWRVSGWAVCDGVKAGGHSQIKGDTAAA